MKEMGVRSVLIRWFASYLNERSHFTRDAGTTDAAGAVAPVAFFIRKVVRALRVHIAQRDKNIINMFHM